MFVAKFVLIWRGFHAKWVSRRRGFFVDFSVTTLYSFSCYDSTLRLNSCYFALLSQQYDEQQKLSDVADLIETFYMFNTRITKKMPVCYGEVQADCTRLVEYGKTFRTFGQHISELILLVAMKAMMLPETGPIKKSVGFLTVFIKESRNCPRMMSAVAGQGENILRNTFLCLGNVLVLH